MIDCKLCLFCFVFLLKNIYLILPCPTCRHVVATIVLVPGFICKQGCIVVSLLKEVFF